MTSPAPQRSGSEFLLSGKVLGFGGIIWAILPIVLAFILGSLPLAANQSGEGYGAIAWFAFFTIPTGVIASAIGVILWVIGAVRRRKYASDLEELPRLDSNQQPLD